MFSVEGNARSNGQNRQVACYLAFVGGFVNSSGFVLIGTFTSHTTGNVGRLANDAAVGHYAAALAALSLVVSFFVGAFSASVILECRFWSRSGPRAYALALTLEALLLLAFTALSRMTLGAHARVLDAEAALLCAAMGLQNALVTRLSGAVVRTTHLTGVITDLGIEAARWFRFWHRSLSARTRVALVFGHNEVETPDSVKLLLLLTIAMAFVFGAACGAVTAVHFRHGSMLLAAFAVCCGAVQALRNARRVERARRVVTPRRNRD